MNEEKILERYKKAGIDIPQEFFAAGTISMLGSDNIFMWNDKKYTFLSCSFEPTITMQNVDDEKDTITFAITSELKDELVLVDK